MPRNPILLEFVTAFNDNVTSAMNRLQERFTWYNDLEFAKYKDKFDPDNQHLWEWPDGEDGDPMPPPPPTRKEMNRMVIENGNAINEVKGILNMLLMNQQDHIVKLSDEINELRATVREQADQIYVLQKDVAEIYKSEAALEVGLKRARADGPSA